MAPAMEPVYGKVLSEKNQDLSTRRNLYRSIESHLRRPLICFLTSFVHPVRMEDSDVDMLAGLLQTMDLHRGLAVLISSPGGDGLAAERMIKVCKSFSGTSEYFVIVPGKAKSAATMFCLGASKIYMGPTSELGPIDPQVVIKDGESARWCSACNIVDVYKDLMAKAASTKGNLEPFLQQLSRFDARVIKEYERHIELSGDIAVASLCAGMMTGTSEAEIRTRIAAFLTPQVKKTHGRPIYSDEAIAASLSVNIIKHDSDLWAKTYELYIRLNSFVSTGSVVKCVENSHHTYVAERG